MQRSTKITLIVVGAIVALSLIAIGFGTLCSAPAPQATDGFESPIGTVWQGMVWSGYLLLACGAALTLFLVVCVLRMVFGAIGEVVGGVEWLVRKIRDAWYPAPPALETVMAVKNGKSITLQDILGKANAEIKELKSQLAEVTARTAHIEPPPPPPPPKTAEEVAAEQATLIANLQRQLAAMQQAQSAAKATVQTSTPATELAK